MASSIIAAIPGLGDAAGSIIKGARIFAKCEQTVKVGKAVSTTCRMIGAIAQIGVNAIDFDKAFRSVRKEYRETGRVSFLNGANAVLSALGVVGGVAQSVSSIQNFDKMMSSLSSKPRLSNGSSQQYANIADGVCFVAGTEVKTEEGRKAIEEIEAGDRVYARNTETGEEGYKEVVRVFRKETKELIHLWIGNTKIDTTPNHPFWIEGYGFREAGELQEGDKMLAADREVLAVARVELEVLEELVRVYNFEVADWHTYYVSGEEVLVHNDCTAGQGGNKADLGNKLDYQFGKAGGNKYNIDRTNGLRAEMDKLGFDDTLENRVYFEQYYNDVLNDANNLVGGPQPASYIENGITYHYTVTTRESFLMGKYGGAKVTTYWDGNRLLTIKIASGKQTRFH